MCYNQPMSACFFLIGVVTTVFTMKQPKLRKNYFPVISGFYTIMELSQAIEYSHVNQCGSFMNNVLSEIAYLLVIVQPLMCHTVSYLRNRDPVARGIFKSAIGMFVVWMFFNILSRVSFVPRHSESCIDWSYLYSNQTCIMRHTPTSHLYWQWASSNFKDYHANFLCYLIIWFVPPLFVTKERLSHLVVLTSFLFGTLLTFQTGRWQEHASIWCFVSIPTTAMFYTSYIVSHFAFTQ